MKECGTEVTEVKYAEVQQSRSFTFSVEINADNHTVQIYRSFSGASDPERTPENSSIDKYDLDAVRDLVKEVCSETADPDARDKIFLGRLELIQNEEEKNMEIVKREYDELGHVTYTEYDNGYWDRHEYNDQGHVTYYENSVGSWQRYEYDERGNETYCKDSDGWWELNKYDEYDRLSYCENSYGYWGKYSYDENGKPTVTTGRKNDDALRQMTTAEKIQHLQDVELAITSHNDLSAADYRLYLDIVAERKETASEIWGNYSPMEYMNIVVERKKSVSETAVPECVASKVAAEEQKTQPVNQLKKRSRGR